MVKDGLKISLLAGMFFVYPALADDGDSKPVADKNLAMQEQPMDQPAPNANYQQEPTDGDDKRADFADAKPEAGKNVAQQEQPTNQEAPHRDYQPPHKEDDQHGEVLSEADENVYESDQQQYEQAQADMNASLDKRNNELNDRINQEQNKLQKDKDSSDNLAIEDDKQRLIMDKSELHQQELLAANHSENLEEFSEPDRPEMPVSTETVEATPAPEPEAPPQKTELAMNQQQARVPW